MDYQSQLTGKHHPSPIDWPNELIVSAILLPHEMARIDKKQKEGGNATVSANGNANSEVNGDGNGTASEAAKEK